MVRGNLLTCPMSKAQKSHQKNIVDVDKGQGKVKDKLKFKCFFKALNIVMGIVVWSSGLLYLDKIF